MRDTELKQTESRDLSHAWDWLEDDVWKLLTNVQRPGDEEVDQIVEKYGDENVRVDDDAYDYNRNIIPDHVAVFVKREAFAAQKGGE